MYKRQVIDHAQHHRARGVDHVELVQAGAKHGVDEIEEVNGLQEAVDEPRVLQQGHPGVGPQQEVHPHGQHDQYHGRAAEALARCV